MTPSEQFDKAMIGYAVCVASLAARDIGDDEAAEQLTAILGDLNGITIDLDAVVVPVGGIIHKLVEWIHRLDPEADVPAELRRLAMRRAVDWAEL